MHVDLGVKARNRKGILSEISRQYTVQRNTYFPPPIAFSMKMEHKASPYAKIFASRKMKKDMSLTPRN